MSVPGSSRWIARVAIASVLAGAFGLTLTSSSPSAGQAAAQAPGPADGKCPAGYVLKGDACEDVDECVTNNGGCVEGTQCVNTPGLWQCGTSCPPGFTGSPSSGCQDVNECATSNGGCDALTMCTNTVGGRTCGECPDGYAGDGFIGCVDVNECADGDCSGILERRARARDNIPPVITTPEKVSATAIAASGAAVTFNVTAKDNVDGNVPVTCTPASGANFPVGTTKATCSAADKRGNKGTSIVTVTVTQAQ